MTCCILSHLRARLSPLTRYNGRHIPAYVQHRQTFAARMGTFLYSAGRGKVGSMRRSFTGLGMPSSSTILWALELSTPSACNVAKHAGMHQRGLVRQKTCCHQSVMQLPGVPWLLKVQAKAVLVVARMQGLRLLLASC